jgi:thiol-disulfide isomerase/thioredoxin
VDATESTAEGPRPSPRRPWLAFLLVAAVTLIYSAIVGGPDGPLGTESAAVGHALPFFELEPLTGDSRRVSLEDLKGRVTLVNYWGTWCPPCRAEFPEIAALAERFGDRGDFRLYAVSCGEGGSDDAVGLSESTREFLKSGGFKLPTYADPRGASRQATSIVLEGRPTSFAYPTTLVIDRRGIIRGCWQGYDERATREMARLVEELLNEPES